jgi:DNA-binding transcriptional LysR family regulator
MILDLNDLRIFVAVAEAGSISRAAEQLNYVQSNVTARIKIMEERLGVTLFNRLRRGVILSGSGKLLLDYAGRILALSSEAERVLMEKDTPSGSLVIGSLETAAAVRLPGILAEYHLAFPQVDLQVITGTTEELINHVIEYTVDAAFIAGEVEHSELVGVPVFQEELVLATGNNSSIENDRKRTLIVFRRGCSYRAKFEGWLRDSGYIPYQVMEFGTVDGILGCVRAGMGMTVLPRAVFKDVAGLTFLPLPPQVAHVDTMLVSRKDVVHTKAMTEFRKVVNKHSVERARS